MGAVRGRKRSKSGFSISEILLATILSAAAFAVIGELTALLTMSTVTTWTKTEGLAAAQFAMARITNDVRHARAFGDFYATNGNRISFPAPNNPIYPTGAAPAAGWPVPPWKYPMVLSDTVLVIQQPVFLSAPNSVVNGVPLMLPSNLQSPPSPQNQENLTTVVYEVLPDPNQTNEFVIQVARFPGAYLGVAVNDKPINPPQTILKGLIGPTTSPNQPPSVFSYLRKDDATKPFTISPPDSTTADLIAGVAIDFEIRNTNLGSVANGERFPQTTALHSEALARSNKSLIFRNFKP